MHVFCPNTLTRIGKVTLRRPKAMLNESLEMYNKHYPLLSDNEMLYIVGMSLSRVKLEVKKKKKEEYLAFMLDYEKALELSREEEKKEREEMKRREEEINGLSGNKELLKKKQGRDALEKKVRELEEFKRNIRKEAEKRKDPHDHTNICRFHIYRYDLASTQSDFIQESDLALPEVQELYQSFGAYFQLQECAFAFKFKEGDMNVRLLAALILI